MDKIMRKIESEDDLKKMISEDGWMMEVLRCAAGLDLPDWMIGAGFVRNKVWDELHGYDKRTLSSSIDIDLIYFDACSREKLQEKAYERELKDVMDENWSVKNHARISDKYESCEDGLSYWPETCTAIAVKLTGEGELKLIAPFGLKDLLGLVVRIGPKFDDKKEYENRIRRKKWEELWPDLKIIKD